MIKFPTLAICATDAGLGKVNMPYMSIIDICLEEKEMLGDLSYYSGRLSLAQTLVVRNVRGEKSWMRYL